MTERSDSVVELVTALSKFQGAVKSVPKTSSNPFFHSKYADLDAVWEMCRQPLTDNGLALVQTTAVIEGKTYLETTLYHTSGQHITGRYPIFPMRQVQGQGWSSSDDPQSIGSALTYARRYAMSAMLGISADEDDDAEKGMKRQASESTAPSDNRYQCPIHKTKWFKRSKMQDYAHPIGDTGEWCNMKDAPLDISEDAQDRPQDARTAPLEASSPSSAPGTSQVPASVGELLTRATLPLAKGGLGYKNRTEVFAKLGIQSALEIASLAGAWQKLQVPNV